MLTLLGSLFLGLALSASPADARSSASGATPKCAAEALKILREHSPHGTRIYRATKDKKFFLWWIRCDDIPISLATSVHESVHVMSGHYLYRERSYFLPDQTWTKVRYKDLFHRGELLEEFGGRPRPGNIYDENYLLQTGNQDIVFILEEFNAYVHDLMVSRELSALIPEGTRVSSRDALANFMFYLKRYLKRAKLKHPKDWEAIAQDPEYTATIRLMWRQAEAELAKSCPVPQIGMRNQEILRDVYAPEDSEALLEVLGFAPALPKECVRPPADPRPEPEPPVPLAPGTEI